MTQAAPQTRTRILAEGESIPDPTSTKVGRRIHGPSIVTITLHPDNGMDVTISDLPPVADGSILIDLPPAFYDDHVSRGLNAGLARKRTQRYVRVELDAAAWAELLSDARHYADGDMGYAAELPGLVASARATVKRLQDAPTPWTEEEAKAAAERYEEECIREAQEDALKEWKRRVKHEEAHRAAAQERQAQALTRKAQMLARPDAPQPVILPRKDALSISVWAARMADGCWKNGNESAFDRYEAVANQMSWAAELKEEPTTVYLTEEERATAAKHARFPR